MMNMAAQMSQNPDFMRQMMDNPMMQRLMENPDVIRSMISSQPELQRLMESHPELRQALADPEMLRRAMRAATDPSYRAEMMRGMDQAFSNISAMPGGEMALQRFFRDVQGPLEEGMEAAAARQMGMDGDTDEDTARSGPRVAERERPNAEPLPNPWGPPASAPTPTFPPASAAPRTTGASL